METKLIAIFVCAVAFLNGALAQKEYVDSKTVNCSSTGIDFHLSKDPATSELFKETGLKVDLFTGSPFKPVHVGDFDIASGEVKLDYDAYQVVATIVYGENERPLQYAIEQPFYAVPQSHKGRNYTFAVYCIIQAYANVNVSTNTSDQGHGDHGGDVVNPTDHIEARLYGLQLDGSSTLGDPLNFALNLKDDKYSGLIPVTCRYYNPNNKNQNMIVVADKCPIPFSQDEYFSPMKKINAGNYRLDFKAFSFETTASSFLAIECDIELCISTNPGDCKKTCWGDSVGTTTPGTTVTGTVRTTEGRTTATTEAATTGTGSTEAATTEAATTEAATTEAATTEAATTEAATTEAATTEAATTEAATTEAATTEAATTEAATTEAATTEAATTEAATTEAATTEAATTEAATTEEAATTTAAGPARKRRSAMGIINDKAPTSVTITERQFLKVNPKPNTPGGNGAISNQFTKNNLLICLTSLAALRFWF